MWSAGTRRLIGGLFVFTMTSGRSERASRLVELILDLRTVTLELAIMARLIVHARQLSRDGGLRAERPTLDAHPGV